MVSLNAALNLKVKSIWGSLFQFQNAYMIQKSMKPIDSELDHHLDDYRLRRQKNNESVRKSREKNRAKLQECADKVQDLQQENSQLNQQLDSLQNELFTLKGLFQHCFSFNLNNLSIKPSEIPTSTLYKMIMKKDLSTGSLSALQSGGLNVNTNAAGGASSSSSSSSNSLAVPSAASSSSQAMTPNDITFNEQDEFYINQIKSALQNIVRTESISKMAIATSAAVIADSPVTSPGQSIPSSDNENVVNFDLNDDDEAQSAESNMMLANVKDAGRYTLLKQQQQQQQRQQQQHQAQAQLNYMPAN